MKNEIGNFRGLLYNPTLENEVVMLFSLLIPHLEDSFAIDEGDSGTFPDCFALRNGERVGIEFELYANHFFDHRHNENSNLTKCNIIICWENDILNTTKRADKEFVEVKGHEIEIISLDKKAKSLGFIKYGDRPNIFRKNEERFFEQINEINPINIGLVNELYNRVKQSEDFEVKWGGGERWSTMRFFVKKWGVNPISVYGDGSVEIGYQDNKSRPRWWELPQDTIVKLGRIFKSPKHKPWQFVHLKTQTDLVNVYEALKILAEDSKRFDSVVWHPKS